MTEGNDTEKKKGTLSLGGGAKTLSLKSGPTTAASAGMAGQVRQSFSGGRTKTVAVELRRKRGSEEAGMGGAAGADDKDNAHLSNRERETRLKALEEASKNPVKLPETKPVVGTPVKAATAAEAEKPQAAPKTLRQREMEEMERIRAAEMAQVETIEAKRKTDDAKRQESVSKIVTSQRLRTDEDENAPSFRDRLNRIADRKAPRARTDTGTGDNWKRTARIAISGGDDSRGEGRSLASVRRARQKARDKNMVDDQPKQARDIVLPEVITVQELANRMAERASNLIKSLMKMGVMATVTQTIDADTAELLIVEFGHKVKRVTEGDIEMGIEGLEDNAEALVSRPPVVTIMGHVDHGKTSLLDALRQTNVVAGEAGGITQHIGAYQITAPSGRKITFLDTPGHAAFSAMRARGANITDIVVLVVAANDGIMPQTIEAISHAKAAGVPLIVAVNKIDLPDAKPEKIKQDLLQHEIIVEEMGGETLCVEVSAKKKLNLDKLEETILLQADVLDLKANPNRAAAGTVVESRMETGRGSVATVLVNKGTLNTGDIFVVGSEWGRVRALLSDTGKPIKQAVPGQPVEVQGLSGTPEAGDDLIVVENEGKARDIAEYRQRKKREMASVLQAKASGSMDDMFARFKDGDKTIMPVVIKGDVHGSVEAIAGTLAKITEDNPDVTIQVLHTGVGGITETDVSLASASKALIIGFNVRANAQARDLANKQGVDIRYYSIIYNVIDDVKQIASGMLSPLVREEFIGNAEIREVFNITKVGKIAGCMVTQGFVKRGAKVRLLRDNVVVHEGKLKTLKRFKDEVKEVKEGTECGMAFENYEDIRAGDVIECFDVTQEQRSVA